MPKKKLTFPYCKLRQKPDGTIRPRYEPGPRERALGFAAFDLKHDDGSWYTLDEVATFARSQRAAIAAARANGAKAAPATVATAGGPKLRTVADLIDDYLSSDHFRDELSPASQKSYQSRANAVRYQPRDPNAARFSLRVDEPFALMPAKQIRPAQAKTFYEHLRKVRGGPMAHATMLFLSSAFGWAKNTEGWEISPNPCSELKLRGPGVRVCTFTVEEIKWLVKTADDLRLWSVGDAIMVAVFNGQRQGDILALVDKPGMPTVAERAVNGRAILFVQHKTGAKVGVFSDRHLVQRLTEAEERRRARPVPPIGDVPVILCESTGKAWGQDNFRKQFNQVRTAAAVRMPALADKQFRDLRDTALTWLALSKCTIPEICSYSGHSLATAHAILKHYLDLEQLLETARGAQDKFSTWLDDAWVTK